jgi:hypothetical protein
VVLRDFSVIASRRPRNSIPQFPPRQGCAELVQLDAAWRNILHCATGGRGISHCPNASPRNQKAFAMARWASC